ncbi:MAG: hypothetical protein HY791_08795 [Deltaproteobacteria bacterium]|nr:hypothetical protein [Deltaproteobacteria bacterium]
MAPIKEARVYFRSLLAGLLALSCSETESVPIGSRDLGESCGGVSDCKPGLDCRDGVCALFEEEAPGPLPGQPCDDGCGPDLCCGNQDVCRPLVEGWEFARCGEAPGHACALSADCDVGLVCSGEGVCAAAGGPGTGGVGASCGKLEDCQRPLFCGLENTCDRIPFFPGTSCLADEEELGAFRMYFEVPRGQPLAEFYRHPFPSDVRFVDGKLDMSGHPTPGEVLGVDFTKLYIEALQEDANGFALSAPIFVRFSDEVDRATLATNTSTETVMLVNLSADAPTDRRVPVQKSYRRDKGQVICGNALGVAPVDGFPLAPRTTYALIVTTGLHSVRNEAPIQDADFAPMLQDATPADPAVARAHQLFAPLRAWLSRAGFEAKNVAGATVFTTGDPAQIGEKLRAAVHAAPAPVLKDLVLCDGSATSPCDGPADRGCLPVSATHHQLQGRVTIPIFQAGNRPYRDAGANGRNGAFVLDANEQPTVQGNEDLCFGLSVPKGPMPAGGWPVVIYGHGTGGDYTSGLRTLAGELANIDDGQGNTGKVAVLTFDNVMHGPRQGLTPFEDPGPLFFNVKNPRAARDNVLQGAADVFSLIRFVRTAELLPAETGLASSVRFDDAHVIYYGHSQGTVIAPPVLAFEPNLRAAVMTGAGAEIGLTVLEKKKPNDVSSLVRVAFGDQSVTRVHPIIGFLSFYFGPSDAIPYAPKFAKNAPEGRGPTDLLHVYGLEDGYAPESTQAAWARAAGEPIVGATVKPLPGLASVPDGAKGNVEGMTLGLVQYAPPKDENGDLVYDGHFVGTRDPKAKRAIERFILEAATTDSPATIVRGAP